MPTTLERAFALAARPRALPYNPFERGADLSAQDREQLLTATLDAYHGKRWQFFQQMPGEMMRNRDTGEGLERPGRIDINNLRNWIDTLSNTYGGDPVRVFKREGKRVDAKTDPVIEAVADAYRDAEVDRILERVDSILNLAGNAVLRPIYDEVNAELVVHRYDAPCVRVVPNLLNARKPEATVLVGEELDENSTVHTVAEVWTDDEFYSLRDGRQVNKVTLSAPPALVHCFNQIPDNLTRYWAPCIGPALAHMDVVLNNDVIGPLGYTTVMQGYAQAVIWGLDPAAKVQVGPGRIIQFNGDVDRRQDFDFKTPGAPIPDVLEVVRQMMLMIRSAHGIPEGLLDVTTDATGAAIVQANAPLAEMREKRGKVFRRIERDLLRATITVLAGRDKRVPAGVDAKKYDVSVLYSKGATQMSVQDRNAREEFLLGKGIITVGDIAVREYPERWDDPADANAEIAARAQQMRDERPEEDSEDPAEESTESDEQEPDEEQSKEWA